MFFAKTEDLFQTQSFLNGDVPKIVDKITADALEIRICSNDLINNFGGIPAGGAAGGVAGGTLGPLLQQLRFRKSTAFLTALISGTFLEMLVIRMLTGAVINYLLYFSID